MATKASKSVRATGQALRTKLFRNWETATSNVKGFEQSLAWARGSLKGAETRILDLDKRIAELRQNVADKHPAVTKLRKIRIMSRHDAIAAKKTIKSFEKGLATAKRAVANIGKAMAKLKIEKDWGL